MRHPRFAAVACTLALSFHAAAAIAAPPRIVDATPNHADVGIDAALTELRVTFDQDMMTDRWSFCGGGPSFPELTGQPRWEGARTVVLPVSLEPGKTYELSINCQAAQNFRSRAGEAAEIYPIAFRTGADDEPLPALDPGRAEEMMSALRRAIDTRYSHRDLHGIDWDERFDQFRPALEGATTPAAFARAAAELLRANNDLHVSVRVNGFTLPTSRRAVTPNIDARLLARTIPQWREFPNGAAGRFDDGIAYLAITTWEGDDTALADLLAALEEFTDARGLIVDVRLNAGGNELLAQRIASCFVEEPTVYSRNQIRGPESPRGWAGPFDRIVSPASDGPRFDGPVAILIGPACMSSCESFILMMRKPEKRLLFGARTWGSSGNPRPHDLGEGVTVTLSSWLDMTPDGELIEGRGIEPDVAVEWKSAANRDAVLEAALAWLRSQK